MTRSGNLSVELERLQDGKTTFGQFLSNTRTTWIGLALYLMKRWRVPAGVEVEDVVQELHMGVYRALGRYNPEHPNAQALSGYVVYNACDKAKKWIHRQRGALLHGNPDAAPGNFPLAFGELAKEGADPEDLDRWLESLSHEMPAQEAVVERKQFWRDIVARARSPRLQWALIALEANNGHIDAAARSLYENQEVKLRLRLGSESAARATVRRAIVHLSRVA